MRILQVIPTYLPAVRHGGPARAVHGLAKALVQSNHDVVVFTTDREVDRALDVPLDRPIALDGVEVRYFPAARPWRLARSPEMAAALAEEIAGFDLVHLHGLFQAPAAAAARFAKRGGVPWVVSPRGMLVRELLERRGRWRKRAWLALAGRRVLGRAARLIATSELERRQALELGIRLPAIELLPNGVEPGPAPDPSALPGIAQRWLDGGATFVYLGRLSWKKGLECLVRALALVPKARLLVVGNDEEGIGHRLDAIASELGLSSCLARLGFVDGGAKSALLAGARALVLPSLSENFGNVVVEAWSCGTPVVVTPGVGLADEVAKAQAGLVVEGDPAALAEALRRLAVDPGAAEAMGERGRQLAVKRFAWPAIAERAEQIYGRVVAERPRRR